MYNSCCCIEYVYRFLNVETFPILLTGVEPACLERGSYQRSLHYPLLLSLWIANLFLANQCTTVIRS